MRLSNFRHSFFNMENEIWKPIFGFECYYEISNKGSIKSLDRVVPRGNSTLKIKGIIKKHHLNSRGYAVVDLEMNGKRKRYFIHRLVAFTFLENKLNKPNVNHKDSNPLNNTYSNLEWVTQCENMQHAVLFGNIKRSLSKEIILYIFKSEKRNFELNKDLGICKSTIGGIRRGERYSDITGYYSEKKYKGKHYLINDN